MQRCYIAAMSEGKCKNCGAAISINNTGAVSCPYCQTLHSAPATNNEGISMPNKKVTKTTTTITRQQNGGPVTTTTTTSGDDADFDAMTKQMNDMAANMMSQFGNTQNTAFENFGKRPGIINQPSLSTPSAGNGKKAVMYLLLSLVGFALVGVGGVQKMTWLMTIGSLLMVVCTIIFIYYLLKAMFSKG